MSSSRPGSNRVSKPSGRNPNIKSGKSKKSGRSSAYDNNFEKLLLERYVDPPRRTDKPGNLEQWKTRMRATRASLSPTAFTDEDHDSFLDDIERSEGEPEVMQDVFIKIRGQVRYPSATNRPCGNWAPLLSQLSDEADLVTAQPDYCEGNAQDARDVQLRRKLDTYIVPSTLSDVPFLPNFFLEAKGYGGSMAVAARQARYDGALGARGMHQLQTYGLETFYDNNAYTVSAVYLTGNLIFYAHHLSRPEKSGSSPHYHMTRIDKYGIDNSPDEYRKGVTAFRNLQDLAHEYREQFLLAANRRLGLMPELGQVSLQNGERKSSSQP